MELNPFQTRIRQYLRFAEVNYGLGETSPIGLNEWSTGGWEDRASFILMNSLGRWPIQSAYSEDGERLEAALAELSDREALSFLCLLGIRVKVKGAPKEKLAARIVGSLWRRLGMSGNPASADARKLMSIIQLRSSVRGAVA